MRDIQVKLNEVKTPNIYDLIKNRLSINSTYTKSLQFIQSPFEAFSTNRHMSMVWRVRMNILNPESQIRRRYNEDNNRSK